MVIIMKQRLIVLNLILDKLGISSDINTINDRKRVQKTIFLVQQVLGIELGYKYGWYLMGPYSKDLTKDYYDLAEALALRKPEKENQLIDSINEKLKELKTITTPKESIRLNQEDWLELLASYEYLINRYSEELASQIIEKEKPNLFPYIHQAETALASIK